MFARLFHTRARAAERALDQGRIDDAFELAREADFGREPRALKLLDDLARALLARARIHRQAGRYPDAVADLDRLAVLERAGSDAQAFRQQVLAEMQAGAAEAAERREAAARAAEHLRAGRLETGRLDLGRVEDTRQREELAEELELRLQRGRQLVEQAGEALARDDLLVAIRLWQDVCSRFGRTRETDALAARLVAACRSALERWHQAGRLERLLAARPGVAALVPHDPSLAESERLVELCARAAAEHAAADYEGLRRTLLRLKGAGGEAAWVTAALEALARIAEGQELLMASPLGLLASAAGPTGEAVAAGGTREPRAARVAEGDGGDGAGALRLDRPLLLLVDGGGSSLLVPGDRVRLGRAGSAVAEVPLPADVQSHHADLLRRDEDYFLEAHGPAEVNGRAVQRALLCDGDRIALGRKARMVLARPSPMSASAVLRLSHRCRLAQDVGAVILFRDTCLIGPDAGCHVRTREGGGRVVLFSRGGRLHARVLARPEASGGPARPVHAGQTLALGDVRLTVKAYEPDRPTAT